MATRITSNRLIEDVGATNGLKRVTKTNAPAIESESARFMQFGPFRKANLAINLSAVQLTVAGVDSDAGSAWIAPRGGVIIGIAWSLNAAESAGAVQLQASLAVGGTSASMVAKGDLLTLATQSGTLDESAEVSFSEGDALGMQVTTNGTFAPTADDLTAWLLVRLHA